VTGEKRSPTYNVQVVSGLFETVWLADSSTEHWNMKKRGQEKCKSWYAL
jgi:hypothetical protein